MGPVTAQLLPRIAIANFALSCALLLAMGWLVMRRPLTEVPAGRQNAAEMAMEWFVSQARTIAPAHVALVAPFLATLFLVILIGNLLAVLPVPVIRIPPAAYFSVPLALAFVAVFGVMGIEARIEGVRAALRHLVWPNPLQVVGEASHALSLALRLYGNIGGEYIVAVLAAQAAPWGIPVVIHTLGLMPAVVQPLVFTLLTANFLAAAMPAPAGGETLSRPGSPRSTGE